MARGVGQRWARGQLELPFPGADKDESEWREELATLLGSRVSVRFSRSRSTPIVIERDRPNEHVSVRLHEIFRRAPSHVVDATAAWIRSGKRARRASAVLDDWLEAELDRLPQASVEVLTEGRYFDLAVVLEDVIGGELGRDFADRRRPRITWGRSNRRARRSLQLGSYDARRALVTINPVVDRAYVPAFFVRYLVFHELLHAVIPAERGPNGRWSYHPPAFRARERAYRDYNRAVSWQAEHLDELLAPPGRRAR